MTTFTVGELIERTKDLLLGAAREEMNQLASAITASTVTLTLNYSLAGLSRGTYISIDTEIMYVWRTTAQAGSQSSTITVQRGMKGTTPAAHLAHAPVYVNPYFTRWGIRQALRDEIRSWGPQVFSVRSVDITLTNYVRGYTLGELKKDWLWVLKVTESPDLLNETPSDKQWKELRYTIDHSGPTNTFPNGNVLTITNALGVFNSPRQAHVVYAAPFTVDTAFTDAVTLLETVGLDSADLDIPPYGAATRLATSREIRRMLIEGQGQASDLQNVPPMYALQAAAGFEKFRDDRLLDAQRRIMGEYPVRRTS